METRNSLIQKIHIAKTQLRLDDDTYQDILANTVGKTSCKDCNISELIKVLDQFKAQGFVVKSNKHGKRPTASKNNPTRQQYINKIEAIIASEGLPWSYVHGICQKSFGKARLQFCDDRELQKVMQMLAVYQYRQQKRK